MQNIFAYYINVYRNDKGEIVGSEDGIMGSEAAAENEAVRYVLEHDWRYIETLSNHSFPINFSESIKDAEYNKANPESEWTRKQWNEICKRQQKELEGSK